MPPSLMNAHTSLAMFFCSVKTTAWPMSGVRSKSSNAAFLLAASRNITDCSIRSTVVEGGAISTFAGSRSKLSASAVIDLGMVAENRRVWRSVGTVATICAIGLAKPMSSIWSASSSTSASSVDRSHSPCSIRSSKRPGVATMMSTPASSAFTWWNALTPPKIVVTRGFRSRPKVSNPAAICDTSSRVGASTRTRAPRAGAGRGSAARRWSSGSAKAAVLPVPVCAMPSMSRPCSSSGIAPAWIGVGLA